MKDRARDALLEATVSAFRERDASGRIRESPAWWDLSEEDRDAAFELQLASRLLERSIDPHGSSTTARAVIIRTRRIPQWYRDGQRP